MIREEKKIPEDVLEKIPTIIEVVSKDNDILALYAFGSLIENKLQPLSDLDFGIVLSTKLSRKENFDKHLDLIGIFNNVFRTDEIDLILMNDAPPRFTYHIIKTGKLLFMGNKGKLAEFQEFVIKHYLDFKYYRDEFDSAFLKGIGYNG